MNLNYPEYNRGFTQSDIVDILNQPNGTFDKMLSVFRDPEDVWQPSDFFPQTTSADFFDRLIDFRKKSNQLPRSILISIIFSMIVEESLPNYQAVLSRLKNKQDKSGSDKHPWASWLRRWAAEENRHGEVLSRYLYLCGRVDMRSVEVSVQNLLICGFNSRFEDDLYCAILYTSFQERITRIFNQRISDKAKEYDDLILSKICSNISADENRHEFAYKTVMKSIFEMDPLGALRAFCFMTSRKIIMPGKLLFYGNDRDLYSRFSVLVHHEGIQKTEDYAIALDHLIEFWGIRNLKGLCPEGQKLQERICGLTERYMTISKRADDILSKKPVSTFPWLCDEDTIKTS